MLETVFKQMNKLIIPFLLFFISTTAYAQKGNDYTVKYSAGFESLSVVPYPFVGIHLSNPTKNITYSAKAGSNLLISRATAEIAFNEIILDKYDLFINYGVWTITSFTPYTGEITEIGIQRKIANNHYYRFGFAYDPNTSVELYPAFGIGWFF